MLKTSKIASLLISLICAILLFIAADKVLTELLAIFERYGDFNSLDFRDGLFLLPNLLLAGFVGFSAYRGFSPKITVRDRAYVLKMFEERKADSPAPTKKILLSQIYGDKQVPPAAQKPILDTIDANIKPIKKFLSEDGPSNTLCINSGWGSGKTTSLLIAISETELETNRYIYESTFKYTGNINEFVNDVLRALRETLLEAGVQVENEFSSLIGNLDSDLGKTLSNLVRAHSEPGVLSTDLVARINEKYSKAKHKHTIFLLVDDIDRLDGPEIEQILSLLSVVRNLHFVKIIVPADLDMVCRILEVGGVVRPRNFINKYLPLQSSVRLMSSYEISEQIIRNKISYRQDAWDENVDTVQPALAAIYLRMLANLAYEETANRKEIRYPWLMANGGVLPTDIDEKLLRLLEAPKAMAARTEDFSQHYAWNTSYDNIRLFSNLVYALTIKRENGGPKIPANRFFTDEIYNLIDNWIFIYMRKWHDLFDFSIRDALDVLNSVDYDNLPREASVQFVHVYNQLFPNKKLRLRRVKPSARQTQPRSSARLA